MPLPMYFVNKENEPLKALCIKVLESFQANFSTNLTESKINWVGFMAVMEAHSWCSLSVFSRPMLPDNTDCDHNDFNSQKSLRWRDCD